MHSKGMSFHLANLLARFQVPEIDTVIMPAGNGSLSIWRKGHRPHRTSVTLEALKFLASCVVPQANRGIVASRQAFLPVGGKSDGINASGMALESPGFLARLEVQQPQRLVSVGTVQHLLAVGEIGRAHV